MGLNKVVRYSQLLSFQKHLASAAPAHLCRAYLIAIADDYERRGVMKTILSYLGGAEAPLAMFSGVEATGEKVEAALAPSLFGKEPIVWIDEVEKMSKDELEHLLQQLPSFGYLLLGAKGKNGSLFSILEKEGVVLDLLEEKPWEREKRLLVHLVERASQSGKHFSSDTASFLMERVGADVATLDGELDKLVCFVGERASIDRSDVVNVTVAKSTLSLWQMAEELIWEKKMGSAFDPNIFPALLPALRFQLQLALKIASLIEGNLPREQWPSFLPKIWPKTLEKRRLQVEQQGVSSFRRALDLLFELEQRSRSGASSLALLDLFRTSFYAFSLKR